MPDAPDETGVRDLVHEFYARVREHPELGPLFEERLAGRWPEHLERMCAFWNTVLFGARSYRGDPMGAHTRIPGLEPHHFSAWMDLFTDTAAEVLPPAGAADVVGRAERMRQALERTACAAPDPSREASTARTRTPARTTPLPLTTS